MREGLGLRKRLACRGYLRQRNRGWLGAVLHTLKRLHAAQNANKPRKPTKDQEAHNALQTRAAVVISYETDVLY